MFGFSCCSRSYCAYFPCSHLSPSHTLSFSSFFFSFLFFLPHFLHEVSFYLISIFDLFFSLPGAWVFTVQSLTRLLTSLTQSFNSLTHSTHPIISLARSLHSPNHFTSLTPRLCCARCAHSPNHFTRSLTQLARSFHFAHTASLLRSLRTLRSTGCWTARPSRTSRLLCATRS